MPRMFGEDAPCTFQELEECVKADGRRAGRLYMLLPAPPHGDYHFLQIVAAKGSPGSGLCDYITDLMPWREMVARYFPREAD